MKRAYLFAILIAGMCILIIAPSGSHSQQDEDKIRVDQKSINLRQNSLGWAEVFGEIVNETDFIIGRVRVAITLKDETGKVLDTGSPSVSGENVEIDGFSNASGISPGGRASFSRSFSAVTDLDSIKTIDYTVTYDVAGPRTDINETPIHRRIEQIASQVGALDQSTNQSIKFLNTRADSISRINSTLQSQGRTIQRLTARVDSLSRVPSGSGGGIAAADFESLVARVDSLLSPGKIEDSVRLNTQRIDSMATKVDSLLKSEGKATSDLPGDLDNDGDVDFPDFLIFAQNFGKKG